MYIQAPTAQTDNCLHCILDSVYKDGGLWDWVKLCPTYVSKSLLKDTLNVVKLHLSLENCQPPLGNDDDEEGSSFTST